MASHMTPPAIGEHPLPSRYFAVTRYKRNLTVGFENIHSVGAVSELPGHVLHRAVNSQGVIKISDGHRNVVIRGYLSKSGQAKSVMISSLTLSISTLTISTVTRRQDRDLTHSSSSRMRFMSHN